MVKPMRLAATTAATIALMVGVAHADEGMWTLDNVPTAAIAKATGFTPDPAWLKKVQLSSVRLAGGCSGSFVSGEGLVMTNHHCVADCVAELSSANDDVQANGFLAKDRADERKCAGIEVNQLTDIIDVTDKVNKATAGKNGQDFANARRAALTQIEKECAGNDASLRCDVVTLYQGGRYNLYKYQRYQDVRLAFAPEAGIAAFGGDPDNFNFPRYCLDMSLLRVYGADGKPLKSPNHFKWSKQGTKPGEATFVSGHPGSTSRQRTIAELEFVRDEVATSYLFHAQERRGRLIEFGRENADRRREAFEPLAHTENGIKVWHGRQQALADKEFFGAKVKAEQELRAKIAADPKLSAEVGDAFEVIAKAQDRYAQLFPRYIMLERMRAFDSDLAGFARSLLRAADESKLANNDRLREFSDARLPALKQRLSNPAPVHKDLEIAMLSFSLTKLREAFGPDDAIVKAVLGKQSPDQVANAAITASKLSDPAERLRLFEGGKAAIDASDDPLIKLMKAIDPAARAARKAVEEEVEAPVEQAQARIAKARFAIYGDSVYPDATFSLRLSYGKVQGWEELDGHQVEPYTTFAGAFERDTGAAPFDLPTRWDQAKGKVNMSTPFNAVTTNDIIGGNSGSPALNSKAEVIGLVFDGNIHSLSGDYGYEPKRNRTVMVDVRGMTEALRNVYGADQLIKELGVK
ncbi:MULTISPECIES: S46 family peptidase [unclassified Azospirillum]|uniref:S46 family peptidase n=1 Tax=unclassified Azospirillum TaxID=2630922 RepID=UPI000B6A7E02|nr:MULTISPECIES: S46 family peptidase [unclassified Azospirillum]SNS19201.1 dipeptidyl-peptidase 7. Serine peptidase. MEROPS family S46 [Azospirillum sp. RU38E]SNS36907.1 dipeptidyl-peptidase 7. Serine peptidase. MEROPS family S46 [Azospirillum sp. RU37A]